MSPWSLLTVPAICTSILGSVYEPSAVNRVMNPVLLLQYGLTEPRFPQDRTVRMSHELVCVSAVLKPPWNTRPLRGLALTFSEIEFDFCVWSP